MPYDVILRTHGGLGNQIFQIFFGRLFSERIGFSLKEVHDSRYPHAFKRSDLIARGGKPTSWQEFVSSARAPKLLQRILGRVEKPLCVGRTLYLDGYFQGVEFYKPFAARDLSSHLNKLADELAIVPAYIDLRLVHLRVGDFFKDESTAKRHVLQRLEHTPEGSHIMTNNEPLLHDREIARFIELRELKLIATKGMPAEEVLRIMARYRHIEANNSTLAFWSSVFGGCEVLLGDKGLSECRNFLSRHK